VSAPGGDRESAVDRAIYDRRFPDAEAAGRDALWRVIAGHLQRYFPPESVVLDIGAGNGEFISNIRARERWASDIRDTSSRLDAGVRFVLGDGLTLLEQLVPGHFDRIFMSNYLEHLPSSEAVIEQLRVASQLLKPGGRAVILQPNIGLIGAAYWDFIDHRVPLTERSLTEAVELAGLRPVETIKRFLPYTTKGRLPTSPALARIYLALRPAWRVMGKQTLMIAERAVDHSST
jgi:SAM-dependent methyltransferase